MSLRANIDHLNAAQGIEAVAVITQNDATNTTNTTKEFRGDDSWSPVLDGALSLLAKTSESTIRMVIGKHTVVVQTEKDETVAVVLPTGHAIAKSLRRMIRRMARKVRPPLRTEPTVMSVAPSQPGQPGTPKPSSPDVPSTSPWG